MPRNVGVVRVTRSKEDIEKATQVGLERAREGYSPEALVLAVDEVLSDMPLSRAIVVYVQTTQRNGDDSAMERPFSIFSVFLSIGFSILCLWLVFMLLRQVGPATTIWTVILLVLCQALLLRFAARSVRLAAMSACDGLNDASYPTRLHPLSNASSIVGSLRLRRMRALVLETADRIVAGEKASAIRDELTEVNLTPRAARIVVALARINAAVRDYLPPYEPRWIAYTLAIAFIVTCLAILERAGDRLAEGYQNYALGLTGWIAGDLAMRPKRRPRSPAS